jgi:endoglucanase
MKIFILILFIAFQINAEIVPRFNNAGYAINAAKRCIVMSDESLNGFSWKIRNKNNQEMLSGTFVKSACDKSAHMPKAFNYEIEFTKLTQPGKYKISIADKKEFQIEIKTNPYDFAPGEIVSFLKQQRSGVPVPPENEIGHSGDVKCRIYERNNNINTKWQESKTARYVDMSGGWYDAGDYLKFTLTTAYTTYFLLRAYEEYPETSPNNKAVKTALLDEALWGMNYLLKTMPDDSTFIIQVGNADDHQQGERMPYRDQLNGQRHAYSAISTTQMGLTAAALALGSRILSSQPVSKIKHDLYRQKAIQIYKKARVSNEKEAWFEQGWEKFYADDNGKDNMLLAATELFLSTNDPSFLRDVRELAPQAGAAYWSSWANVNLAAHSRLYKTDPAICESFLKEDLDAFQAIANQPGNLWGTPHPYSWATLYCFFGVANGTMVYSKASKDTTYNKMATDVLDYTMGMNNWGACMLITRSVPGSVKNIYSQKYHLYPEDLDATGAIAEGPGDKKTHDELMQYFKIPAKNNFEEFNTNEVVFYDNGSDFQCMETTIAGLADGIFFFTLVMKK